MSVNLEALRNLVTQSQEYSSTDKTWLKLKEGVHQIRLCPPWSEEGTPVRMIVQHQNYKNKDGNRRAPLCYQYVFDNQNIVKALMKVGVLTPKNKPEFDLYQKIGCIYCKVATMLKQQKNDSSTFGKPAFLWNVAYGTLNPTTNMRVDQTIYKWTSSKKTTESLIQSSTFVPTMFNADNGNDLQITATGENLQRRYGLPMLIPVPVPLGIDLTTTPLNDLDQAMGQGYCDMNMTMELMLNTFPGVLQVFGINPAVMMQSTSGNPF